MLSCTKKKNNLADLFKNTTSWYQQAIVIVSAYVFDNALIASTAADIGRGNTGRHESLH